MTRPTAESHRKSSKNSRVSSKKSSSDSIKARVTKLEAIATFASRLGYSANINEKTGRYIRLEQEIISDRDKIGTIMIEHESYPEIKGSDEYIHLNIPTCALFAREAKDLALMLQDAAKITEKLDKLN